MKVVIAPDSFKDAMRCVGAAQRIADGLRSVSPDLEIDPCPVADGGEGFAEAMTGRQRPTATHHRVRTTDPLGRPIDAHWALIENQQTTGVVELSAASGLEHLTSRERDPTRTSTFGTGLILRQMSSGKASQVCLGIGGSATNDAGCGIAQALGVRFFDAHGQAMTSPITGADLQRIASIDTNPVKDCFEASLLRVACDVDNPLTGPNGAAYVYAPQKGASHEQVEQLDAGLRHLAQLWRDQLGVDVEHLPGAGAAGGVGGGMVAMLGAELVPGAELVLDCVGFDERIKDADLVITGEGRLDAQSLHGKAAMAVAKRAKAAGVPCIALVGSVGEGAERVLDHGLTRYIVIGEGLDPAESIRRTGELLERAAARLAKEHFGPV